MKASPPAPEHEIRDGPAAAGRGGLARLRQLIGIGVVRRRIHAAGAFFLFCGFLVALRALWQPIELAVRRLQTAAAFLFRGCLGGLDALRQLLEPEDHRLQAAAFLLTVGGCTVINGTVLNRSANPEHLLVGFVLFTLGAAIAILTLAGGGAGRAAAQMERFIRGFF